MRIPRIKSFAVVCLLASLLGSSCTTLRAVNTDPTGAQIRTEFHPGDRIVVTLMNGSVHRFTVTQVGANSLSGDVPNSWSKQTDPPGSHIDAPYSDIQSVEVARSSGGKNTLLVVLTIVAALAIALAVATGGGQHAPGFNR